LPPVGKWMPENLRGTEIEIERWRQRERRLLDALQHVDDERGRLDIELGKVEQQITYYDSLTREMKRELGRPGLSSLLSSLRRP
jgi:predicted  nucleic acid-binding Zn-ribbon protein